MSVKAAATANSLSLWVPWVAHVLNNTTFNLLHITTVEGLDSGLAIRGLAYLIVALLSMFLVEYLAERFRVPEVKPWGQWTIKEEVV
jgi:hypothetical protein